MNPAACFVHSRGIDEPETADAHGRLPCAVTGRLQVRSTITALPRTRVIPVTPEYTHSECRSAVFEFIDNPELPLHPHTAGCVLAYGGSGLKSWTP